MGRRICCLSFGCRFCEVAEPCAQPWHVCREYFKSVAAPKLFLGSGPLAKLIVERCPLLQEPYWPAPLAFSAHAQTMMTGVPRICATATMQSKTAAPLALSPDLIVAHFVRQPQSPSAQALLMPHWLGMHAHRHQTAGATHISSCSYQWRSVSPSIPHQEDNLCSSHVSDHAQLCHSETQPCWPSDPRTATA